MEQFFKTLLEIFYSVIGLLFLNTAVRVFLQKNAPKKYTTALYWLLLAILFTLGSVIPPVISGLCVMLIAILTLFKGIKMTNVYTIADETEEEHAQFYRNKIFIPVIVLAISALVIAQILPASSRSVLGISSGLALIISMILTKTGVKETLKHSDRMVQQVGTMSILPQLLAALGVIFTTSGVGEVISKAIGHWIPHGSPIAASIAYVLGMVLFTMIMGNAFAAFTVITAGIGIPFVFAQGANPVVAGALAMTAGYCGTLITPMAGNFNVLPVALLKIKDKNLVIKEQLPFALIMIVVHVVLMVVWAF